METVLAPRLLVYGRRRVFWKCVSGEDVDVGSMDWNGYRASAGLTTIRLTPDGKIIHTKLSVQSADILSTSGVAPAALPELEVGREGLFE